MKGAILIVIVSFGLSISAQTVSNPYLEETKISSGIYDSERLFNSGFISGVPQDHGADLFPVLLQSDLRNQPVAPILTTKASDLEICTGNSTRLTANSNHPIFWYTTPPPVGLPVGTGTSYVTPALNTGYYTFYAIAEDNGIKSDISSMEVVMVYPTPTLNVSSSNPVLCVGETTTLTVTGTRYYEWENGPVSSEFVIKPAEKQSYKVTGINTAGCKASVVYTQVVEACVAGSGGEVNPADTDAANKKSGIDTLNEHLQLSLFPNPNNGEFNLTTNSVSGTSRVEIYNSLGALIYNQLVKEEKSLLDIRNYPNGIYVVRIVESNKVLKQQRLIKD